MAPSLSKISTIGEFLSIGPWLMKDVKPIVDAMPSMLKQSFPANLLVRAWVELGVFTLKLIGNPCNGPTLAPVFDSISSNSFARFKARSKKASVRQQVCIGFLLVYWREDYFT